MKQSFEMGNAKLSINDLEGEWIDLGSMDSVSHDIPEAEPVDPDSFANQSVSIECDVTWMSPRPWAWFVVDRLNRARRVLSELWERRN